MIRLALNKYALSRSSADASEAIRTQAEVDMSRLVSSMATVHYLAWAIPALGFLGTVYGLAGALGMAAKANDDMQIHEFITKATGHLNFAFDCTLVSLVFSIAIMFLLHSVQRDEETVVIDCQQYCQEHLINRLYDLEPVHETSV
jgi:biopolymer transport protein ExbB/TolQ